MMASPTIEVLSEVGGYLERLLVEVDGVRDAVTGTEITSLSEHVLSARDDLSNALDLVDLELGRLVRKTVS